MSTFPVSSIAGRLRRALPAALLTAGLLGFPAAAQQTNVAATNDASTNLAPAPRKPCIIFILADDLGYGEIGCYGQTRIKTPNIDKLAEEGMRFTSFYAGDTLSAGSRESLFTGKHTGHTRMRGSAVYPWRNSDLTVSELLKQAGYRNGAIGKWGLGGLGSGGEPNRKGFDEWYGYLEDAAAHDYYPEFLDRSRDGEHNLSAVPLNQNNKKGKYSNDGFTEAALNFMESTKPDYVNYHRPYFLYLPYTIPHANVELGQATGNGMQVPSDAPYSGERWPQPEKNKAAMITRLDLYVGKLLEALKAQNNDKNTIIIFSSDNGPHSEGGVDYKFFNGAGKLRGMKRDLYEGGIRVPMIVRWPIQIKPGTASDLPLAFWDILPTFAAIAGTPAPKDIDGISFLPTLLGRAQTNRHEYLYWEVHDKGFKQAVRMGDWKAVRVAADTPLELYNLKDDIGEKTNVAEKNPEVLAKIETYLKTARTDDPNLPIQKTPPPAETK